MILWTMKWARPSWKSSMLCRVTPDLFARLDLANVPRLAWFSAAPFQFSWVSSVFFLLPNVTTRFSVESWFGSADPVCYAAAWSSAVSFFLASASFSFSIAEICNCVVSLIGFMAVKTARASYHLSSLNWVYLLLRRVLCSCWVDGPLDPSTDPMMRFVSCLAKSTWTLTYRDFKQSGWCIKSS